MSHSSAPASGMLPNLPGFRDNRHAQGTRTQQFKFVNGYALERTGFEGSFRPAHTLERSAAAKRELEQSMGVTQRRGAGEAKLPEWLAHDREVLRFEAFFKEPVHESPDESFRVRYCTIFLYLEDNTIQISEHREENSGIPQGAFVKRHKVPKDADSYYSVPDFNVGAAVTVYGRTFRIYACDEFTRQYLASADIDVPPNEEPPQDAYTAKRRETMRRETGADESVYRGIRPNPMKTFAEAQLGKFVREGDNLRKFLEGDGKVLELTCAWDDRTSMYGLVHKYKMHYYLADDTMDVINVHTPNSGQDPFDQMLGRCKLPKDHDRALVEGGLNGTENIRTEHYHWRDLRIGSYVNVFGRAVRILDCNPFTRRFYEAQGMPQPEPLQLEEEKRPLPRNKPPPYTAFTIGSEEDSLGSCRSLQPKPPKKDFFKILANDGKQLRFRASLVSSAPEDAVREFIVIYYLSDDTVSVYEPPIRNSGVLGGRFQQRKRVKTTDNSRYLDQHDFFIGSRLFLAGHRFVLSDCDEYTQKYMASHADLFPMADVRRVLRKVVRKLHARSDEVSRAFSDYDTDGSRFISHDAMTRAIRAYFSESELNQHEIVTIIRYFDKDSDGRVDYPEFCTIVETGEGGLDRLGLGPAVSRRAYPLADAASHSHILPLSPSIIPAGQGRQGGGEGARGVQGWRRREGGGGGWRSVAGPGAPVLPPAEPRPSIHKPQGPPRPGLPHGGPGLQRHCAARRLCPRHAHRRRQRALPARGRRRGPPHAALLAPRLRQG